MLGLGTAQESPQQHKNGVSVEGTKYFCATHPVGGRICHETHNAAFRNRLFSDGHTSC